MSGLKKGFQPGRVKQKWDGVREGVSARETQTAQDRAEAMREAEEKRARRATKRLALMARERVLDAEGNDVVAD